ncbi:hypothetical protein HYC85_007384 [Camellia sinensis]|uniref:MLO-like protein n=1 Tax=Camellia sinensis TaxID=4442 RepID=A0A7J7HR94_CAMSI|nr:hypothetical protein HYC85_007384 [Camellia sinensis]
MVFGFISLLLTVFQGSIIKICANQSITHHLLPCKLPSQSSSHQGDSSSNTTETTSHHRRLLAEQLPGANYCAAKNKVPLLSVKALHHLHIFIFVLAIVHVTFCVLTVVFGGAKIRLWKHWEDSIAKDNYDTKQVFLFQAILWIRHQIRLHDTETWFYHALNFKRDGQSHLKGVIN